MPMTRAEVKTSRMIFYIEAIVSLVYGLLFLFIPRWMFALSQDPGVPDAAGWVRWSGGLLIGVGVAAWFAAGSPTGYPDAATRLHLGNVGENRGTI